MKCLWSVWVIAFLLVLNEVTEAAEQSEREGEEPV